MRANVEFSKYTPGGKELNERFRNRFGKDMTGNSATAYQAVWVLQDALERAGTMDKENLRDFSSHRFKTGS